MNNPILTFFSLLDDLTKKELINFDIKRIITTWPLFKTEVSELQYRIDMDSCLLISAIKSLRNYNEGYLNQLPTSIIKDYKQLDEELNNLLDRHETTVKEIFNIINEIIHSELIVKKIGDLVYKLDELIDLEEGYHRDIISLIFKMNYYIQVTYQNINKST